MGRGQSLIVNDKHFTSVIGDKRGSQQNTEAVIYVIKPQGDYGFRQQAAELFLSLLPTLPCPAEIPVWVHEGLFRSFISPTTQPEGQPKTKAAYYKLKNADHEMSYQLDGEGHRIWETMNSNKKDTSSKTLAIATAIDIARWLIVFPDLLDSGERRFLELCWAEILPSVTVPGK